MAYSKTNWVNGQTPINETNLNKIEQGIYEANEISISPTEPTGEEKVWIKRGKNRYNDTLIGGTFAEGVPTASMSTTRIRNNYYIPVTQNKDYTISATYQRTLQVMLMFYDKNFNFITNSSFYNVWKNMNCTFRTTVETKYIMFVFKDSETANITTSDIQNIQIEEGTQVTEYEAHEDTKVSIKENNEFSEILSVDEVIENDKLKSGTMISVSNTIKFKAGASNDYCLYKTGKVVNLILPVDYGGNIPSNNTLIAKLPSEFFPRKTFTFAVGFGDPTNYGWTIDGTGYGMIYDQGDVHIRNTTGKTYRYAFIAITYMTS